MAAARQTLPAAICPIAVLLSATMSSVRLRGICGLIGTGDSKRNAGATRRTWPGAGRCVVAIERQWALAVVFAVGAGLVGCRTPAGGLAFWSSKPDRAIAYTAPDTNKQKYEGLSQEFASSGRPMGQPPKNMTA